MNSSDIPVLFAIVLNNIGLLSDNCNWLNI